MEYSERGQTTRRTQRDIDNTGRKTCWGEKKPTPEEDRVKETRRRQTSDGRWAGALTWLSRPWSRSRAQWNLLISIYWNSLLFRFILCKYYLWRVGSTLLCLFVRWAADPEQSLRLSTRFPVDFMLTEFAKQCIAWRTATCFGVREEFSRCVCFFLQTLPASCVAASTVWTVLRISAPPGMKTEF